MKLSTRLTSPRLLLIAASLALVACGKEVQRESTAQPAAQPPSASNTLTVPQDNNQPPLTIPVQPAPQQPVAQVPVQEDPIDFPDYEPSKPSKDDDVIIPPSSEDRCARGRCTPSLCDDMRLVKRAFATGLRERSFPSLDEQEASFLRSGLQRETEIRARFEGESCTTYTNRCSGGCSTRTVCGRTFLVTAHYLMKNCGQWIPAREAIGVRMVVGPRSRDAVVVQTLTREEIARAQLPVRSNLCR